MLNKGRGHSLFKTFAYHFLLFSQMTISKIVKSPGQQRSFTFYDFELLDFIKYLRFIYAIYNKISKSVTLIVRRLNFFAFISYLAKNSFTVT